MMTQWILRALLVAACGGAFAQGAAYPNRPLTIIVPYAGGSGSDVQARLFGQHLSVALGQPVLIENRPGASGALSRTPSREGTFARMDRPSEKSSRRDDHGLGAKASGILHLDTYNSIIFSN